MTGPYAAGATLYWAAGWRGIIPLPPKAKKLPPAGYTGAGGLYPSYPDVDTWATGPEGQGNIALRMPPNVLGIDVDAYGDKQGKLTIAEAQRAFGEDLPATWRTTSRDDGVSGIRLYRIPEGLAWPGEIGPGVELIQSRHRYALVWPSIHPEGKTYRWIGPDGVVSTTVPDPDELPLLPDVWVHGLTANTPAADMARVHVGHADAVAWIVSRPHATATMCTRMEKATDQMADALTGSAHNAARDATLRIARLADEGHHGAVHALAWARKTFLADATSPNRALLHKARRTDAEATHEWAELVASAVGIVQASPTGPPTCDCFGQLTAHIAPRVDGANALAPDPITPPAPHVIETAPDPAETHTRLRDGAAFILDAPETIPTIWGDGDACLWSRGEALMIAGPPGVGKTTLTGQLLRGLIGLQPLVLGLTITPTHGRVLYLAMDRPAQIARALRRCFNETERQILTDKVRVWEGPPPGDVARHPDILLSLAQLADADTLIVDSMKDAAIGLTEDEVAAAYNRARQTCLANGVQILELHHMVKRGANGNKPTELADVYGSAWLTAGAGSVILLWGAAGDPIVAMTHLKQPAAEVGPWTLIHNHVEGSTDIYHGTDVLAVVTASGTHGVTAPVVAASLFDTDKPTEAQKEKARRKLTRLVSDGYVVTRDGAKGATRGKPQAVYLAVDTALEVAPNQTTGKPRTPLQNLNHDQTTKPTPTDKTAGQQTTGYPRQTTTGVKPRTPPPIRGGVAETPTPDATDKASCDQCGRDTYVTLLLAGKGRCPACAAGLTPPPPMSDTSPKLGDRS
jgi:KaiC/GvpD/RAD55 family RecA-like ATPase